LYKLKLNKNLTKNYFLEKLIETGTVGYKAIIEEIEKIEI